MIEFLSVHILRRKIGIEIEREEIVEKRKEKKDAKIATEEEKIVEDKRETEIREWEDKIEEKKR